MFFPAVGLDNGIHPSWETLEQLRLVPLSVTHDGGRYDSSVNLLGSSVQWVKELSSNHRSIPRNSHHGAETYQKNV